MHVGTKKHFLGYRSYISTWYMFQPPVKHRVCDIFIAVQLYEQMYTCQALSTMQGEVPHIWRVSRWIVTHMQFYIQFTKQCLPILYTLYHACTFLVFCIIPYWWFWTVSHSLGGDWFCFAALSSEGLRVSLPHSVTFSFFWETVINFKSV